MSTNRKKLIQGLKYLLVILPLLVIAPILITVGYKAININNNYIWLILGIIASIGAIIIGILGLKIILSAFFDE